MPVALPDSLRVLERGWLSCNSIIGIDGDHADIIDSGYVGQADQTVALVGEALAGRPLLRLINTHSHSDHMGGNQALKEAFGCRILIPAGIEQQVLQWDEEYLLLNPARQRNRRFNHDGVVGPGDPFRFGALDWQILAAPGHDMEALMFHCPEADLLITGDALWEDGFGIVFGEILGEGLGMPGALAATRQTLDLIATLAVKTVIPGHGAPFAQVDQALERAWRRLRAFEDDPRRMARNALKACFVFNLLDIGQLAKTEVANYVEGVPMFKDVGLRLLEMDSTTLANWLVNELIKAGAVGFSGDQLIPLMAA